MSRLAEWPELLGAEEMAAVFGIGRSAFYKRAKRGAFDAFKVTPTLGPRCYSKALVERYLAGEPIFERESSRVFGRKRA